MTRLEALNREAVYMSRYGILSEAEYDTYKLLLDAVEALEDLTQAIRFTPLGILQLTKLREADVVLTKLKENQP